MNDEESGEEGKGSSDIAQKRGKKRMMPHMVIAGNERDGWGVTTLTRGKITQERKKKKKSTMGTFRQGLAKWGINS